MRRAFFTCLSIGFLPLLILASALALVFADQAAILPGDFMGFLQYRPFFVAFLGVVLGCWFNRSRAVFAMLVLSFCYWFFFGVAEFLPPQGDRFLQLASLYIIPLNMLLFAFMSERGVFRKRGIARILFLAVQLFALMLLAVRPDVASALSKVLDVQFIELGGFANAVPQAAIILFSLVFLVLLARGRPLEFAFACTLPAVLVATLAGAKYIPFGYLAATGIILLALVQEAWRMAFVDDLTGLSGRRALVHALAELGGKYSVAMLDIDHFKKLNDVHGHDAGDFVLRKIARELAHIGHGGKAFRYGGEEFAIVFSGRDVAWAYDVLDHLRDQIAATRFTLPGKKLAVGITVSVGISEKDGRPCDAWDVLKEADEKLYLAKNAGRNRVVV